MMKKLNTPQFFTLCFLAALLAEAYCFTALEGDPVSVVGIGVVVLITAYLLLDSIIGMASQSRDKAKAYVETIYQEEAKQWKERFTELVNIQKATYAAFKKNSALMEERIQELHSRLESLEETNSKALLKIAELQMKALEGQKNSVNLEVNYSKQNTLQIIDAIKEGLDNKDYKDDLLKILEVLNANQELLKEYRDVLDNLKNISYVGTSYGNTPDEQEEFPAYSETEDYINYFDEEEKPEAYAEYGENEDTIEETLSNPAEDEEPDASITSSFFDEDIFRDEYEEKTPETADEVVYEAAEEVAQEALVETVNPTVIPLYDDPNKKLSPEEIAALFSSYGQ